VSGQVQSIGQISINARDVPRATAFYRDILGLRLLFEAGGMAFFDCGGVRLMISKASAPEYDHPGSILYYRVGDIHAAAARLGEKGAQLEGKPHVVARMPDHVLWMVFVRDTEGNLLALMSEDRS
jgi:methylmalonyl-CoA/ethylmalonyl-CoA epimerase